MFISRRSRKRPFGPSSLRNREMRGPGFKIRSQSFKTELGNRCNKGESRILNLGGFWRLDH